MLPFNSLKKKKSQRRRREAIRASSGVYSLLTGESENGARLPEADLILLTPLKRSPEYWVMRRRMISPIPVDSWQKNGLHFFVFELRPASGQATDSAKVFMALFVVQEAQIKLISVSIITLNPDGQSAEIEDLR